VRFVLIGTVVDNNDPQKAQRVKVRCRELHYGFADEALPWLRPGRNPSPQANSTGGVGGIALPVLGSRVYVALDSDDGQHGEWYSAPSQLDLRVDELIANDYPHCYGYIDRSGTLTLVNTERDTRLTVHPSGMAMSVDGLGRLKVIVADAKVGPNAQQLHPPGLTLEIIGDCHVSATGNTKIETMGNTHIATQGRTDIDTVGETNLHSSEHVNVDAPRIDLNTYGVSVEPPVAPPIPPVRTRPTETPFLDKTEY
jgi:hypothetical protein